MTPSKIRELVDKEADARFGETIERLLSIVRNRHTHSCNTECGCEYCRFITGEYVSNKLRLHRLKRNINHLENDEYWRVENRFETEYGSSNLLTKLQYEMLHLKGHVAELKSHKKDLQTNII